MVVFWIVAGIVLLFGFVVFFGAPYVPSKRRELEKVFKELYGLTSRDVLVDLGSGDGIVLRVAAKTGAKAIGYELNPALVLLSRFFSRGSKNIRIVSANMWQVQLPPETTVVYVFAVSRDIGKVARKLQSEVNRLRHPISVISYGCAIPHMTALRVLGAHHLYTFAPLQPK
ncbi:MAG TPA: methyltransferase domain-containing protein [Candidatus Saccharimonadales bacterium]|nr:methyltransferase domain-containing protein [Candidatus Saccharimonadales bacterium]